MKSVLHALEQLAPLRLAESWDNVGLLVEPEWAARGTASVRKILLCNDLTRPVLQEAVEAGAQVVVSYHPPIFAPLKRLRWGGDVKEQIILDAAARGIAVYSPHTACDSVAGGVNDWLANGLGGLKEGSVPEPLDVYSEHTGGGEVKIVVFVPADAADGLRRALSNGAGAGVIGDYSSCSFQHHGHGTFCGHPEKSKPQAAGAQAGELEHADEIRLEMILPSRRRLADVARIIRAEHPYEEPAWDAFALEKVPLLVGDQPASLEERRLLSAEERPRLCGMGRRVDLAAATSLSVIVERVKARTGISTLRVAVGEGRSAESEDCKSVALCAGSGWSILRAQAGRADVLLSGEMGHHDVLAAVAKGSHVILCEHSNSERGFLRDVMRQSLGALLPSTEVVVSEVDADPLRAM